MSALQNATTSTYFALARSFACDNLGRPTPALCSGKPCRASGTCTAQIWSAFTRASNIHSTLRFICIAETQAVTFKIGRKDSQLTASPGAIYLHVKHTMALMGTLKLAAFRTNFPASCKIVSCKSGRVGLSCRCNPHRSHPSDSRQEDLFVLFNDLGESENKSKPSNFFLLTVSLPLEMRQTHAPRAGRNSFLNSPS